MMSTQICVTLLAIITFSACSSILSPEPSRQFLLGGRLLEEGFDQPGSWDQYDREGLRLGVQNSFYRMQFDFAAYVWGQNRASYEDVVIEVETLQSSAYESNGYGVICRASPQNNGRGYYFLVSADGQYSIRRGMAGSVEPLVRWEYSNVIKRGQDRNTIRAVCINNYLALYVNDEFLTETYDDLYHRGAVGLVGVITGTGNFELFFDNVQVWEAFFR